MSQVKHKSKVQSMMEMQIEGNMVSDDDDDGQYDRGSSEEGKEDRCKRVPLSE